MPPLGDYHWELYNIAKDYSENNDLAAQQPEKTEGNAGVVLTEAGKYQVSHWITPALCASLHPSERDRRENGIHLHGRERRHSFGNASDILDKDYTITAEITVPKGGAEGMIVTLADASVATAFTYSKANRFSLQTCLIWSDSAGRWRRR